MTKVARCACIILLLIALSFSPASAWADSTRNDSIATPERVHEGVTYGNVSLRYVGTWPNVATIADDDAYVYSMPAKSSVNLTLRKHDLSRTEVRMTFYDMDGFKLGSAGTASISIPGQSEKVILTNTLPVASDVVILVSGNGTYALSISSSPLWQPNVGEKVTLVGPDTSWIYAPTVDDGTYNGTVAERAGEYVRYYRVLVPAEKVLDIKFEKTDDEIGIITLETFTPFREPTYDDIRIKVYRGGQSGKGSYSNGGTEDEEKLIRVYGRGNYSLEIGTDKDAYPLDDAFIVFFLVVLALSFSIIIPVMMPYIIMAIIAVVLIVVITRSNKNRQPAPSPTAMKEPPYYAPSKPPGKERQGPSERISKRTSRKS